MTKILKNISLVSIEIEDVGIIIAPSGSYTIFPTEYLLFAASNDLVTFVGSGDIVINDGSFDLSKADGISLIQGNFKLTDFEPALKSDNRLKVEVLNAGGPSVQVSSDDQTTGFLEAKVIEESGATQITVLNPGTSEQLQIGLPSVGTAGTYGSATATSVITTDNKGRVSNAVTTPISIPTSQVVGFNEAAQDAVGGALVDSSSVDFTYNDAGNTITASVIPAGVNHNSLQNYVANQHVDHSTVNINAGTGLTGGGSITESRTLGIANTGVTAGTYGNGVVIPQITVNAQGQITSASSQTINFNALLTPLEVIAASEISTTSTSYADMGVSLTPAAGLYLVILSAEASSAVSGTDNRTELGIFAGGTLVTGSQQEVGVQLSGISLASIGSNHSYTGIALVNLSGFQTVQGGYRRSSGSGTRFVRNRRLFVLKVG